MKFVSPVSRVDSACFNMMASPEPLDSYNHSSKFASMLPKDGFVIPNRIFIGGISSNIKEDDLRDIFSEYGVVKAAKIIFDKNGVSKRYGFVTFEQEDQAKRVLAEGCIFFRDRILNVAPAIKRQSSLQKGLGDMSSTSSFSFSSGSIGPSSPRDSPQSISYPAAATHYYVTSQGAYPVVYAHPVLIPANQACYSPQSGSFGYPPYMYPGTPNQVLNSGSTNSIPNQFFAYSPYLSHSNRLNEQRSCSTGDLASSDKLDVSGRGLRLGGKGINFQPQDSTSSPCKMNYSSLDSPLTPTCFLTPPPTPANRLSSYN